MAGCAYRPTCAKVPGQLPRERPARLCSNKGASIVAAIRMLDQILERMQRYQRKRRSLLPDIPAWRGFAGEAV